MKSRKSNNTTGDINKLENHSFEVGKVVGFRGLKGELKVLPGTNNLSILLELETVKLVRPNGSVEEAVVQDIKTKDKVLLISLDKYQDRTSAEELRNCKIYTEPEQLLELEENEWWVTDLIDLEVVDNAGNCLGKVSDVYGDNGELIEVQLIKTGEKKLVPFVKELVPNVNIEAGTIEVATLEGLLD